MTDKLILELMNDVFNDQARNDPYRSSESICSTFEDRMKLTIRNLDMIYGTIPDVLLSRTMYDYYDKVGYYNDNGCPEIDESVCEKYSIVDIEHLRVVGLCVFGRTFSQESMDGPFLRMTKVKINDYFRSKGKLLFREVLAKQIVSKETGLLMESSLPLPKYLKTVVDTFYQCSKDKTSNLWIVPSEILDQIVLNYLIDELLFENRREYKRVMEKDLDPKWEEEILGYRTAPSFVDDK